MVPARAQGRVLPARGLSPPGARYPEGVVPALGRAPVWAVAVAAAALAAIVGALLGLSPLLIVVLAVVAAALAAVLKPKGRPELAPVAPDYPLAGDVRALTVGDVVNHEGADFIVDGTLRFEQGGFVWQEHLLVDGGRRMWLSVEDDEGLELCEWTRARFPGLEPGPNSLEHEGVRYELEERGSAAYTSEGRTGAPPSGRAEFADYVAGDRRLSFERYGSSGDWEVSVGRVVPDGALDIFPARREA